MNNIFLYKLFIGVKKINGHSEVNFSFKINVPLVEQNFPADCWPEGYLAALVGQSTEKEIS